MKFDVIFSSSLITTWFQRCFEYIANCCVANIVPIDKFKEGNVLRYGEFLEDIQEINPVRLVYCDKKNTKKL